MKVEIGESITYSWLRHIKKCQIVQLNWKASPNWNEKGDVHELQKIMGKAINEFDQPFKKTETITQLLKQAEIDGLGINIDKNEIHAVDVAFHENGLNYGSKEKTVQNVAKKILRTAFALNLYFGKKWKPYIYFISPKVTPGVYSALDLKIKNIGEFMNHEQIKANIALIANNDFYNDILDPINQISESLSDTSELFLRSIQLVKMFKK